MTWGSRERIASNPGLIAQLDNAIGGGVFADKLASRRRAAVRENLIVSTPSAYTYPLLVKQLLTNSLSLYGDQEITYRGEVRYTYRDFRRRVGQRRGVQPGQHRIGIVKLSNQTRI